jgi:hypothetical protein
MMGTTFLEESLLRVQAHRPLCISAVWYAPS